MTLHGSKPKSTSFIEERQFYNYCDDKLATNLLVKSHQIQFYL